jgi:hypothetical protein
MAEVGAMKIRQVVKGTATVLVLLHDNSEYVLDGLEHTVFSAFRHLGVPFTVMCTQDGIDIAKLDQHPLLFIPQSGTMRYISSEKQKAIEATHAAGLGLVIYEPDVRLLPSWLCDCFDIDVSNIAMSRFKEINTVNNDEYICWHRQVGEVVRSDKGIACSRSITRQSPVTLVDEANSQLLFKRTNNLGKIVLFPWDIALYDQEYLGHACGMDDVFLRSIVWAARKPFVTWGMPAQAGLLVDDCSGSYDHFGYVDSMVHHGWKAQLALFTETIDEVTHDDADKAKRILRSGWADGNLDIMFHALRYNESFCFNHMKRASLTKEELDDRFERWDWYERTWQIKHSHWAHPHFGEIGKNAIPYFEQRDILWITYLLPFDASWFDVPGKIDALSNLPPYSHAGYYQCALPVKTSILGCNCVLDQKRRTSADYVPQTDYLWNHTPFWNESEHPQLEQAARVLALQIQRGLDSGFYGEGATHEQRIAVLRKEEFKEILEEADRLLERYHFERTLISHSLSIARKRCYCHLVELDFRHSKEVVAYTFSNTEAIGTQIQIYHDAECGSLPECIEVNSRTDIIHVV